MTTWGRDEIKGEDDPVILVMQNSTEKVQVMMFVVCQGIVGTLWRKCFRIEIFSSSFEVTLRSHSSSGIAIHI